MPVGVGQPTLKLDQLTVGGTSKGAAEQAAERTHAYPVENFQYPQSALPSELKIADYILACPEQVTHFSSQELAQQADVSQSSIVKFTQKIGFKGFTAFKLAVSEDLGRKHAIKTDNVGDLYNGIDATTIWRPWPEAGPGKINSIVETTQALDNATLARVLDVINQAGRVQLVGIGGSALTARISGTSCSRSGSPPCSPRTATCRSPSPRPWDRATCSWWSPIPAPAGTCWRRRAGQAQRRHPDRGHLVSQHPLRQMADMVLDTVADENELRISSISSRTAQNTITDILFLGLVQRRDEAWALIDGTRGAIDRLNKE